MLSYQGIGAYVTSCSARMRRSQPFSDAHWVEQTVTVQRRFVQEAPHRGKSGQLDLRSIFLKRLHCYMPKCYSVLLFSWALELVRHASHRFRMILTIS